MFEISVSDRKLFRVRVCEWQEHYMERLTKEYMAILSAPGNASTRFGELEKRIQQDKKHPGVLIQLRKSKAIWDIAFFLRDGVITPDDLDGFSEEPVDAVKLINRQYPAEE